MPIEDEDPFGFWQSYANAAGTVPWVVGGRSARMYESEIQALGGQVISSTDDCVQILRRIRNSAV